jgi:tRNA1Val (adenine37-N6)-methyltransferase
VANNFFSFRQFTIHQSGCALKVSTDSCILGAWFASMSFSPEKILDIGSGTGLLMLMLAQKKSGIIKGIEIEPGCFRQSLENIANSPWHDRCSVLHGDVRVYPFMESFDFIISNPPFYENQLEAGEIKKDMAKHSSHLNLSDLFKTVNTLLTPRGKFGLLLPYSRREESLKMAERFSLHCSHELHIKQTRQHDYFRVILQFEREKDQQKGKGDMVIRENDGSYTSFFTDLLKDYYLYL